MLPPLSVTNFPDPTSTMSEPTPPPDTTTASEESLTHLQSYHLQSINSAIRIRHIPAQGISFQLWPAATTLINLLDRHVTSNPNPINPLATLLSSSTSSDHRRLRILELGSGTGAVGIAAAALLGASVTVTDLPRVLPNLQFNVDANAVVLGLREGAVDVVALSWGDEKEMEAIGKGDYDLILGSDLVYHANLFEPLLETLKFLLLGSGGDKRVMFLMSHLKRWKKESVFFKKANKFFDVEVVFADNPADGSRVGVNVYQFVSKEKTKN